MEQSPVPALEPVPSETARGCWPEASWRGLVKAGARRAEGRNCPGGLQARVGPRLRLPQQTLPFLSGLPAFPSGGCRVSGQFVTS